MYNCDCKSLNGNVSATLVIQSEKAHGTWFCIRSGGKMVDWPSLSYANFHHHRVSDDLGRCDYDCDVIFTP